MAKKDPMKDAAAALAVAIIEKQQQNQVKAMADRVVEMLDQLSGTPAATADTPAPAGTEKVKVITIEGAEVEVSKTEYDANKEDYGLVLESGLVKVEGKRPVPKRVFLANIDEYLGSADNGSTRTPGDGWGKVKSFLFSPPPSR